MSVDALECLQLFTLLDGQDSAVAGCRWRVLVFSVSCQAGALWVQLGLEGGRAGMTRVLRLVPGDGAGHALRELMAWLTAPSDVFSIAQVA